MEADQAMRSKISETEVLDFLTAIERGEVVLTPESDPQDVYAGNVTYHADTGWTIVVFNDANEWDYIDSITTADGLQVDFDELDAMPRIRNYEVSNEISWGRYRIPGHMRFRCNECGAELKRGPSKSCARCDDPDDSRGQKA